MGIENVTTIGDGYYNSFRGTDITWNIDLSGLVVYDDANLFSPFDLLEYWKQMVDIAFQMVFERDDNSVITAISGNALVVKPSLGGDTSFGRSSFTLQGNGEPIIGIPATCDKQITNYTLARQGLTFIYKFTVLSLNSGTVPRYDWRVDGREINTSLLTTWTVNIAATSAYIYGTHTIEVWPICDNGARGVKLTRNFTVPLGIG